MPLFYPVMFLNNVKTKDYLLQAHQNTTGLRLGSSRGQNIFRNHTD